MKNNIAYQLQIPKELHVKMMHIKADTGVSLQSQIIWALRYRFDMSGEREGENKTQVKCAQCSEILLFEKNDFGFNYSKIEPCESCIEAANEYYKE